MKKALLLLVSALLLCSCARPMSRTPDNSPLETPIEEHRLPEDEAKEFDEYLSTMPFPWKALDVMEGLLSKEKEKCSDLLLSRHLRYLESYQSVALEKDGDAFLSLDPFFLPETQTLEEERITPSSLKDLYNHYVHAGYTFIRREGAVEPWVDYNEMLRYSSFLSKEMLDYLTYKGLNSNNPWASDGELAISVDEVGKRILQGETFLTTYKNSAYLPSILEDQEKYLYTFFGALDNSPLAEEGKVKSTFIKAYEQFLDKKPDSPSGIELSGYYNILKDNDFKAPYDQENPEDLLRFRQETEQRVKSILQFYTSP